MGVETALLVGSAGLQTFGGLQSAKSAKAWGNYQNKQAQADAYARIGESNVEAQQIRNRAAQERSSAVAATAANGVVVGEGTAAEIERTITSRGEYDAQVELANGRDAANRILAEGEAAKLRGKQEAKAAYISTAGSLLSTAYMGSKWSSSSNSAPVVDRSTQAGPRSSVIKNKPFGFY